jgi:GNAT superfamily N-acetyltransferase
MFWRLPKKDWLAGKTQGGRGNRSAFKKLIEKGEAPGLLAYEDGKAVGWCALAPREAYPGLARARNLKPVDDRPVWSVSCFFIERGHRGQGLASALLGAAKGFAAERGAKLLEGYPCEPRKGLPDVFYWTGVRSAFEKAGFRLAERRGSRSIMRRPV